MFAQAFWRSADEQSIRQVVISVGMIPELLSLRAKILQEGGYSVFMTADPEEARLRIQEGLLRNSGALLLTLARLAAGPDPQVPGKIVQTGEL